MVDRPVQEAHTPEEAEVVNRLEAAHKAALPASVAEFDQIEMETKAADKPVQVAHTPEEAVAVNRLRVAA